LNAFGLKNAKDKKYANFFVWMLTQDIFKEMIFYGLMALNKGMLDVSRGHDDGNHIGAINSIEMFFMATLMTRANV
jgi:hypothetical protein